jgi:hypothetical protein
MGMITKQQYVEYLICTIGNHTSSNFAEHLDAVSHDVITDYLSNERHTARGLVEEYRLDSTTYCF